MARIHHDLARIQAAFTQLEPVGNRTPLVMKHNQVDALLLVLELQILFRREAGELVSALVDRRMSWDRDAEIVGLPSGEDARRRWDPTFVIESKKRDRSIRKKSVARKTRPSFKPAYLPGLSVPQAAQALGVSTSTVYARIARGELETIEIPKTHTKGVWLRVLPVIPPPTI